MSEKKERDPFQEQLDRLSGSMDVEDVDLEGNWTGIHDRLPAKKKTRQWWAAAASVVLLASVGLWWWGQEEGNDTDPGLTPTVNRPTFTLSDVSPELADMESDYRMAIDQKWTELRSEGIDSAELDFIYDELRLLGDLEKEYQAELQVMGPNEKIIQTILKCYERRIQLLDILMKESQKTSKEERHERPEMVL